MQSSSTEQRRLLVFLGEMAGLGALAVILLVFLASTLDAYLIQKGEGAAVITSAIFELTNTDRRLNSAPELALDPVLTKVAQAKANDMAQKGYFAHVSPEGLTPWHWYKQEGYAFTYAGENLAIDFSDSADVERAWMNSPTHRANILHKEFTHIGIGIAVGKYEGRETTFVVQAFGTPAHPQEPEPAEPARSQEPASPSELALASAKQTTGESKKTPSGDTGSVETTSIIATNETGEQDVLGSSAEGLVAPKETGLDALWRDLAASPRTTLRYAYYLFGILILIALLIETRIEMQRHHLKHVALVVFLIVLMTALFFIADAFVFTEPMLPEHADLALDLL